MIATVLVASAYMSAPMSLESVNFVHSYKENDKFTYELYIDSLTEEMEILAEFEIEVRSVLKDGKTKIKFTFTDLDIEGQDLASHVEALEFELSKHGVPVKPEDPEDDAKITAFVALLITYLPAESLNTGDSFSFKLPDVFSYTGTGKFEGMKKVGDTEIAVLKSKGSFIVDGDVVEIYVTTYYDPASKQIVSSNAEVEINEDSFNVELKRKKK